MKRVLVANRGEIAVRVIRACREHGLEAVAVYADADATAPHVGLADAAVRLEGDPPTGAYLNMDGLIEAARASGADAIHPGYGFLSENADFAERIDRAGLRFVGPPPAAIRTMGDKVASRRAMADAGVPIMPGTEGQSENLGALVKAAKDIPLPLMVKAAGGGGGKGMRIVRSARDLDDAVRAASREAAAAFGNGTVYVERFIERPRHIEVQVLADAHGRTLSVLERECSIQRRHQKIVEECPSPFVTPALRKEMSEAAVAAAEAVGYVNAGTVEFLVDEDGAFYFLEMNTRIQVEHPVTEAVTGLDLVRWQLRIAAGERLPFKQSDIAPRGHAIECRVYAEDPAQKFMPSTGVIARLRAPSGPGVRVDGGIYEGYTVTPHFDPLLAKIVTWGADREAARVRMLDALAETVILGVQTTVPFLRDVLAHEAFAGGDTTTDFIPVHLPEWGTSDEDVPDAVLAAAALVESEGRSPVVSAATSAPPSPWSRIGAWRIGGGVMAFTYRVGDRSVDVRLQGRGADRVLIVEDRTVSFRVLRQDRDELVLELDGRVERLVAARTAAGIEVAWRGRTYRLATADQDAGPGAGSSVGGGDGRIRTPMPGKIVAVHVAEGDAVEAGQPLLVLESMKMQNDVVSDVTGTVTRILRELGTNVEFGDVLVEVTPAPSEDG